MGVFHAYDIRGIYPKEIDEDFAYKLGRAFASKHKPRQVTVGKDMRMSSNDLRDALVKGLVESGVDVVDIGLVSTPQFYYALYSGVCDGGIMVTASHNPRNHNGFKICLENASPLYIENGLFELKEFFDEKRWHCPEESTGNVTHRDVRRQYARMFARMTSDLTGEYHILADAGNGMGAREIDVLEEIHRPNVTISGLYNAIDGTLPNHAPDPIKKDEMQELSNNLQRGSYDFGIGFDGDADRIVFFLPDGTMIPPDMILALISGYIGKEGDNITIDVRSSRAVTEHIEQTGKKSQLSIAGHAYIKDEMKKRNAPFGGEKSGHYFYRSLHFTDSSLMTVCKVIEILDRTGSDLESLVRPLMERYVTGDEVNYMVKKKEETMEAIKKEFTGEGDVMTIDGVSVYGKDFFFNVRPSNTEDKLRLNLEADDTEAFDRVKARVEQLLDSS